MDMQDLSLHGLIGGAVNNIKSVQVLQGSLTNELAIRSIAISPVDVTSTIIIASYKVTQVWPERAAVLFKLADSTTINVEQSAPLAFDYDIKVITFYNVKSLQRGIKREELSKTFSIPITAVSNNSLLLRSFKSGFVGGDAGAMTLLAKINNSQIDFSWGISSPISPTNYIEVAWELIEFK